MFPNRLLVFDPVVVIRKRLPKKEFTFEHHRIEGEFFLVVPDCAKEIFYLQILGKNIDLFVPSTGEGLLIKSKCLSGITPLAD